ncbi:MAG: redoxin domain-containing protein [Planctomycetales bacterium]
MSLKIGLICGVLTVWSGFLAAAVITEPAKVDLSRLKLLDAQGGRQDLTVNDQRTGTVFVFMSTECPISRQYIPELNRLAKAAEGLKGKIAFYGVLSEPSLTRRAAVKFVEDFKTEFPVLFDASHELAELFQPHHVPEAFLVDKGGAVVYRGRIDDLYADIDKRRAEPTQRDLLESMKALAEQRSIPTPKTEAVGCPFEIPKTQGEAAKVTYTRDIAPILNAHCVECHRPGEVAPFSLMSYQDAAKRAQGLSRVTERKLMPPWRAEEHYGHFMDERRLTEKQIALISSWAKTGAVEGDAADLPTPPQFTSGWRLGEPDLVVEVEAPFTVPADGPDIFQHFAIPSHVLKNEMIVGLEFRPGNPAVVHHALVFLDTSGRARARDAETPEPGWKTSGSIDVGITSMLGVWTPGMTPRFFPQDVGIPMDKGADVVIQLHLHPTGKVETDRSKVALYFAKKPVAKVMSRNPLLMGSVALEIPPGEKRYKASTKVTLPTGITLTSIFPHMHLIGKEMKATAFLPDGKEQPLMWIKDWNFYWQDSYVYKDPLHLPEGTRIEVVAYYDNSKENPFNPQSPPKTVLFGNDTTNEMCFALFQAVADDPNGARQLGSAMRKSMMDEWNAAPISVIGRAQIMVEMGKLFGGRRRQPPANATGAKPGEATKEKAVETKAVESKSVESKPTTEKGAETAPKK